MHQLCTTKTLTKTQDKTNFKSAGSLQRHRGWAVLLGDAIAGVAVRHLIVAEAASDHPALLEVGGAALTGVAAHAVLPASRLQDGLPGDWLPVLHVHEQPDKKKNSHVSSAALPHVGWACSALQ